MGRKLKQTDHKASIYFQLFDEDKWLMIDRLMELPKYSKSRTSLINRALDYGLPKLIEEEFGTVGLCEEVSESCEVMAPSVPVVVETIPDKKIVEIVRLLKEIAMTTNISKSIACSLFNTESRALKGKKPTAEAFDKGDLRDTPGYLVKYEIDELKALNEEDK